MRRKDRQVVGFGSRAIRPPVGPLASFAFADVHPDALEDNPVTRYNLVANVCHHGKPHDGFYKAQVLHAVRSTSAVGMLQLYVDLSAIPQAKVYSPSIEET